MTRHDNIPLASVLVRKVFPVYLALAIALAFVQIGVEYRNTYSAVLEELNSTALAFEPGVSAALWNYEAPLLESIAKGMVNGGVVTAVDIGDTARHLRVQHTREGGRLDAHGVSKHAELFHTHLGGMREPIGFITL